MSEHSIQDLLKIFDVPDLDSWWQQVQKEVGSKEISWQIEDDLKLDPLGTGANQQQPILWNTDSNWKILEYLPFSKGIREFSQLQEFEIDEFVFEITSEAQFASFGRLQKPAPFSLVLPASLYALHDQIPQDTHFVRYDPLGSGLRQQLLEARPNFNWQYVYGLPDSSTSRRLSGILEKLILLLNEDREQVRRWRIYLEISSSFHRQIAELRALKILLLNLLKAFDLALDTHPQIVAVIKADPGKDLYANLIGATAKAVSAVLGGIDAMFFQSDENLNYWAEFHRLSRNIHYILKYEGHLGHRLDPLAGSYAIENATTALAKKAWEQIGRPDPQRASE
ncbi:MAG: hypothetical protein KDC80_07975 [Saprospiraceae bacterium]|nr:hypothetical protein [Saprospiraceae bacterium]